MDLDEARPEVLDARALRSLVDVSADGLVLLDGTGALRWWNRAAREALGGVQGELARLGRDLDTGAGTGPVRRSTFSTPNGRRRHLDHRTVTLADGGVAIWLSDVTEPVRQQERTTAITRAAASVADTYSLRATLDAVATEIARTAGIAAVQIHAFDDPRAEVRLLGMAGFGDATDFMERLAACRALGAQMLSIESFTRRATVVRTHRKATIMADPSWAPLHEIMGRPRWDTFVAVPLLVRGRVLGAVNAYYEVGEHPGPASLSFLETMADHAAVAMDTATLLHRTRASARSDERRRLARDLHDSAVQQVFSMRLQAEALLAQLNGAQPDPARVRGSAQELAGLATRALADLRDLLLEMRPLDLVDGGLVEAVRATARGITARHGVEVDVLAPATVDLDREVAVDVQEDVFRIVAEALHKVVKHAGATRVQVGFRRAEVDGYDVVVQVDDDGRRADGPGVTTAPGLGLRSMHERAERWGGHVLAGPGPERGWRVQVLVPRQHDQDTGQGDR